MSKALALDLIRNRKNRISKLGIVEALKEMADSGKLAVHGTNGNVTSLEVCRYKGASDCEQYLVATLFRNGTFTATSPVVIRGEKLRLFGKQTAMQSGLMKPLPYQSFLWLLAVLLFAVPYGYLVAYSDADLTLALLGVILGFGSSVWLAMFISRPRVTAAGKRALAEMPPLPPQWHRFAEQCAGAIRISDMPERR